MIIKGKNGSTIQCGTVFQNGSRVEPFWLYFFSQRIPEKWLDEVPAAIPCIKILLFFFARVFES